MVAEVAAEVREDPLDLAASRDLKLADLVVDLDRFLGLDVERLARPAHVLHEALDLALGLGANGDDRAARANGRLVLGGVSLRGGGAKGALDGCAHLPFPRSDLAREAQKLRAGVVADLAVLVDGPRDAVFERPDHDDLLRHLPEIFCGLAAPVEVVEQRAERFEDVPHVGEFFRAGDGALRFETAQRRPDLGRVADGDGGAARERIAHLTRAQQRGPDGLSAGLRYERVHPLAAVGRAHVRRQPGADEVEAEARLGVGGVELNLGHRATLRPSARLVPGGRPSHPEFSLAGLAEPLSETASRAGFRRVRSSCAPTRPVQSPPYFRLRCAAS